MYNETIITLKVGLDSSSIFDIDLCPMLVLLLPFHEGWIWKNGEVFNLLINSASSFGVAEVIESKKVHY